MIQPFLRDTLEDMDSWRVALAQLRSSASDATTPLAKAGALGRLGDHLRLSTIHMNEAIEVLECARQHAQSCDNEASDIANAIRLATALQYNNQHVDAVALFERLCQRTEVGVAQMYEDYVWQHMGKCLTEMKQWDHASAAFEHALTLRQKKGDLSLISSTQRALMELSQYRLGQE